MYHHRSFGSVSHCASTHDLNKWPDKPILLPHIQCHMSHTCILLYLQAIRVTQEQRGSLKLEAYSHLLQELLIMQLHQVCIASAEQTHNSDFMQVKVYFSANSFQHPSHRYCTHEPVSVPSYLDRSLSSLECHVHQHQAVLVVGPSMFGGYTYILMNSHDA